MGEDFHYKQYMDQIARNTHGIAVMQNLRHLMEQGSDKLD